MQIHGERVDDVIGEHRNLLLIHRKAVDEDAT